MKELNSIIHGDALKELKKLPSNFINTCVTSPPYWGLRDYGVSGQLGIEETPEEFIERMVEVFSEVKRILKKDGTCWINIGDSYVGTSCKGTYIDPKYKGRNGQSKRSINNKVEGLKSKDLVGIPWMLAFALRKDGWYLRQDIIWHKPNCMPESVKDRCTKNHEYIFLLSKSKKYYYDQESILKEASPNTHARVAQNIENQKGSERAYGGTRIERPMKTVMRKMEKEGSGNRNNPSFDAALTQVVPKVNKRSVWTVPNKPFKESHFATFPQELIVDCIKAGCPVEGVVLDPFMGAGTTALVARKLKRNYLGIELNEEYIKIAENRLNKELGLFK